MPGHNRALGASGEALAEAWYRAHGYAVLARNWRCKAGELDLVVRTGRVVVFVEVKARSSLAFGHPAEAVNRTKQQRLRTLAHTWLEATGVRAGELRFDVVAIVAGEIEVLEAAF